MAAMPVLRKAPPIRVRPGCRSRPLDKNLVLPLTMMAQLGEAVRRRFG